jgi:outer membrane scaffolding protein for murein synthesis (MipA/OmpV family)
MTSIDLSASLRHGLTDRVSAVGILGISGRLGDARRSPLTADRVTASIGLGVVRTF